jgi:hypothetical protein
MDVDVAALHHEWFDAMPNVDETWRGFVTSQ